MNFPWPVFRCARCGSVMVSNAMWEEHMRSHQRLDREANSPRVVKTVKGIPPGVLDEQEPR